MANGNGRVRNPLISGVIDEVDVRIARLLGGIDDAAERVAETLQQVEAEVARDERIVRRAVGVTTGGAAPFSVALDLGQTPAGTAMLVTSVSFFEASLNGTVAGVVYLNDPTASDINFAVFGNTSGLGAAGIGSNADFYIPENTKITARVIGGATGRSVAAVLHGKAVSIEP